MFRPAFIVMALAIAICLPAASLATTAIVTDNFDQDTAGTQPPPGWKLSGTITGTSAIVTDSGSPAGNMLVVLHDDNGTSTVNNTLHQNFPVLLFSGICTAQFDLYFAQTTAGFGTRLTTGGTPTSGSSCVTGVLFQGNIAYDGGPTPSGGTICYQPQYNTVRYADTGAHYSAGTWYTLKVVANLDTKKYQVFLGPRGGTLTEITQSGGVPLIKDAVSGVLQSQLGGITFFTSNRNGDASGDLKIDNVNITAEPFDAATVKDLKTAPLGSFVNIANKVVTAGVDQMKGAFCYVQDDTGGIRVRTHEDVHQGDMITVTGSIVRATDSGAAATVNGERELAALSISVTDGPFPLPPTVGMTNRSIGGGPLGPNDTDGYPMQPGVYASGASPNQVSEVGLNNVGRLGRFWGRVTKVNMSHRFIYIDDGSGIVDGSGCPATGVRVLVRSEDAISGTLGQYCTVTGIVGSNSAGEMESSDSVNNVRLIRAVEEVFTDENHSGLWDDGEPYVDSNGNGAYDGLMFSGAGPSPVITDKRIDITTIIYPGEPEKHFYETHFDGMNWVSPHGHYLAMGSDSHRAKIEGNGNSLAGYYNVLSEDLTGITGAQRADEIEAWFVSNFPSGSPEWVMLNEIFSSNWNSSSAYRSGIHDVAHRLAHTYSHKVVVYSPIPNPTTYSTDWQNLAEDAYIGIERYLTGQQIKDHSFSVSWCQSQYQSCANSFSNRGVPIDRLVLTEHFAHTVAETNWGRSGISTSEWETALNARHTALHNVGFAGFSGYAWCGNGMEVPDAEMIYFEGVYAAVTLP